MLGGGGGGGGGERMLYFQVLCMMKVNVLNVLKTGYSPLEKYPKAMRPHTYPQRFVMAIYWLSSSVTSFLICSYSFVASGYK